MTRRGRWAGGSGEDELLSRLYQQVTERQEARFAAGYDMTAGLDRYRAWLGEHPGAEPSGLEAATPLPGAMPLRAAFADSRAGTAAAVIGWPAVARRITRGPSGSGTLAADAGWDADLALTALYYAHYRPLVRLARLLLVVRDVAAAEEIVQDSFVGLHAAWPRLGNNEKALSYLRRSIVERSRAALPQGTAGKPAPDLSAAGQSGLALLDRRHVIAALRALPPRQREALVLRYLADLPEAQIASAMGVSKGAVKSHTARAIAALRAVLDTQ